VNEANSILSDANRRAEYDVYLDRKAKGLSTDVGAILRAEGVFQRGEALFKAGRWEDAEAQFREAISLNHAEAEFHAFLGMSMFRRNGKAEESLQHIEKALEMDPRLRMRYDLPRPDPRGAGRSGARKGAVPQGDRQGPPNSSRPRTSSGASRTSPQGRQRAAFSTAC